MLSNSKPQTYPDDIFAESRMSFGDHLEELRGRLLKAVYGLGIFLVIGFVLDAIGESLKWPSFGIGRPMLRTIVDPVENQVRAFYAKRNEQASGKLVKASTEHTSQKEAAELYEKMRNDGLESLSTEEREKLRNAPTKMPVIIPVEPFEKVFGKAQNPDIKEIEMEIWVYPTHINYESQRGEALLENKQYLTTLSVQEAFVVYFKVSLLCGVVLASPWIFYQLWMFVAAGLYPHERYMVYQYLWPSIFLFIAGVLLCQFVVLPGAVKALLAFNNYIGLDPDLRMNEWLGFALLLPVVFGVSFQTPLVMFFMNRIGMFGWEDYWAKWRGAVFVLAIFSALITPTPDAVTMMYLFVPMFGLYLLGVAVCKFFPPSHEENSEQEEQVAV